MRGFRSFVLAGSLALSMLSLPGLPGASPPALAVLSTSEIAAGASGTCAVTAAGGAKCWGSNDSDQLGNGDPNFADSPVPVDVTGLTSGVASVTAGTDHSCALTTGGAVKCWGWNDAGQVGDGTLTFRPTPVQVLASGVSAITAGFAFTCALMTGGTVKCWGANSSGQLGDGSFTNRSSPVDVSGLSGVSAISAGNRHMCALTSGGAVWCWGSNGSGQLGNGTFTSSATPVAVSGLSSGATFVSAEGSHTCAVVSGAAKCWGWNHDGQLGNNDSTKANSDTPVGVSGLGSGVSEVAAGGRHSCALLTGGGVKCWGDGGSGQLGNATKTSSLAPVGVFGLRDATAVVAGGFHTCVISSSKGIECWGNNNSGALGNRTNTDSSIPVGVTGLSMSTTSLSTGGKHSCAITQAGALRCWGLNSSGQLGDGTTTNHSSPVGVSGLGSGVIAVAAGGSHTCALTSAGAVKCWGLNSSGQVGDGTKTTRKVPTQVTGLSSGVVAIAAGKNHSCAVTAAGGVKCWGLDASGQLGDGTTGNASGATPCHCRLTPVQVTGLTSGELSVAAGSSHTCALSAAGLECWGANSSGQLGNNSTTKSLVPVGVIVSSTVVLVAVTAGNKHTCALDDGGVVKCWGANGAGQLGNGTTTGTLKPVDAAGLSGAVEEVAAGGNHTCAVRTSGAVKCWGLNSSGELGNGFNNNEVTYVGVSNLATGGAVVTSGGNHTCAFLGTGGIDCWGLNTSGQLGSGNLTTTNTPVPVVGFP